MFGGPRCLARTLGNEARRQELDGWREWMADHGVVRAGIIGFCMGGGFALAHVATGADFDVASVNYGAVTVDDLSRACPVVGSYGDQDRIMLPQAQRLVELRVDCDGDTLLVLVDQTGAACHTGTRSCFFRAVRDGRLARIAEPIVDPKTLYGAEA